MKNINTLIIYLIFFSHIILIPFNDNVYTFTTHLSKNAKADSIRILLNLLKEIGWLDVPENAKKVPWNSWQVKPKKYGL